MAGVQIGALHVSLSADSAAFDQGMNNAQGTAQDAMENIADNAKKLAGVLAAYFAVDYMTDAIKQQIDYADALADVAARTNQSVEELSKMEYALHFSDATLADYTDGLKKLSQNMVAAAEGSKEQAELFAKNKIELYDQSGAMRNAADVALDFADKLEKMGRGANQGALAIAAFGKSAGPQLLPAFAQGREAIEQYTKEAEKLGLVVSTDFSNAAGTFNDSIDKMKFAMTGAWRTLATELMPSLSAMTANMEKTTSSMEGFKKAAFYVGGAFELIYVGAQMGVFVLRAFGDMFAKTAAMKEALNNGDFAGIKSIWNDSTVKDQWKKDLVEFKNFIDGTTKKQLEADAILAASTEMLKTKRSDIDKKAEIDRDKLADAAKKAKDKSDAEALAAYRKLVADIDKVRKSTFTPTETENFNYQANVDIVKQAAKQNIIITQEKNRLLESLATEHEIKLLQIQQDGIDAAFAEWAADFDKRKAYEDKIAADKKAALEFTSGIMLDGSGELAQMQAQHDAKMLKLQELRNAETISEETYQLTKEEAERQHAARMLDIQLGTGSAMQKLSEEFNKGMLKGTLQFFAADFGGFASHSRKVFEAQKAAKTAQILLNIPESVSNSYAAGTKIGGPVVGVAFAAAALASQLGQLKAIQSQSFGGGSAGASVIGGAPAALPNSTSPTSQAEQRQTEQQNQQVTYLRIGENDVLLGRTLLDLVGGALADNGGEIKNLRIIPA